MTQEVETKLDHICDDLITLVAWLNKNDDHTLALEAQAVLKQVSDLRGSVADYGVDSACIEWPVKKNSDADKDRD